MSREGRGEAFGGDPCCARGAGAGKGGADGEGPSGTGAAFAEAMKRCAWRQAEAGGLGRRGLCLRETCRWRRVAVGKVGSGAHACALGRCVVVRTAAPCKSAAVLLGGDRKQFMHDAHICHGTLRERNSAVRAQLPARLSRSLHHPRRAAHSLHPAAVE